MATKKTNIFKRIATDILGVLMLIGALAFGWLPGPGGVPLLLGGLGLLSINHVWAQKLLIKAKNSGTNLYELLFPNNKYVYLLYDILGIGIFLGAVYTISLTTKNVTQSIAIAAAFIAFGLLLTNRKRLEKIAKRIDALIKHKQ